MTTESVWPWLWTALVLGLCAWGFSYSTDPPALLVAGAALFVLITVLGFVIRAHQPGHPIAGLLHMVVAVLLISVIPFDLILGERIAVVLGNLGGVGLAVFFYMLFLFPDGRLVSGRWQWARWLFFGYAAFALVANAFGVRIRPAFQFDAVGSVNPIGFIPMAVIDASDQLAAPVFFALALGGVASMIVRYRRADAIGRAQVKWVVFAAAVAALSFPLAISDTILAEPFMLALLASIPVAMTIAITRHNLFEIDRLISRSISYLIVVVMLAGVFVGIVTSISRLIGGQSNIAVAASTLAVATAFNPLRRRIQRAVDRRFNRSSYEAHELAEDFLPRLRETSDADDVAGMLRTTVDNALRPHTSGVWVRSDER